MPWPTQNLRSSWFGFPLLAVALYACGAESKPVTKKKQNSCLHQPTCGNRAVFVADQLTFATKASDGTVPGFDLDGLTSNGRDAAGCYTKDLISPEGDRGVDNQLGFILSALPIQIANTVPGVVQASINDGGLIFLMEFTEPDSLDGHGETDVVFRFGKGVPLLGTHHELLPDQTFELDPDYLLGYFEGARPEKRGLEGGPLDLKFRLRFVTTPIAFEFHKVRFRFKTEADGSLTGVLGGAVTLSDLDRLVGLLNGDDVDLQKTLQAVLPTLADVHNEQTDRCDAISGALAFHAIPAFIFDQQPAK